MIDVDTLGDVCQVCALKKTQFAIQRYCLDCWEVMSNGRQRV